MLILLLPANIISHSENFVFDDNFFFSINKIFRAKFSPISGIGRDALLALKHKSEMQSSEATLFRMCRWPSVHGHMVETNLAGVVL